MRLAQHNHVVETLASDRTDEPLHMLILPRRPRRDRPIPDAQPARRSCAAPWSYAHAASQMHRLTAGGDQSSSGELARIIHYG
jgi:hypothetical protein